MSAAFNYDLQLDAATDFAETFTWYQQGANVTGGIVTAGNPVNLSNATARLMVRQNPTDAAPLISLTTTETSSGGITLGGSAGTVVVIITKAALAGILAGTVALYDLFIDWANGTSTKFLSGRAFIGSTVTH